MLRVYRAKKRVYGPTPPYMSISFRCLQVIGVNNTTIPILVRTGRLRLGPSPSMADTDGDIEFELNYGSSPPISIFRPHRFPACSQYIP